MIKNTSSKTDETVPEGVDTAELPELPPAFARVPRLDGSIIDVYSPNQLCAFACEFGAQQRKAGRRDMHETNVALVNANCTLAEQLVAVRSAFHINMLRAFPDKSHAELDAEITRATGVAGPVSALTDEQILRIAGDVKQRNAGVWPGDVAFARALLAASPKVELDLRQDFAELQFNAQRLRNVVKLLDMENEVPQSNAGLDGARGAVLGQIAAKLRKSVEAVSDDKRDAERLDFMGSHSAYIAWGKDGERCRVFVCDEDGDAHPFLGWKSAWADDTREAIDNCLAASQPKPTKESK